MQAVVPMHDRKRRAATAASSSVVQWGKSLREPFRSGTQGAPFRTGAHEPLSRIFDPGSPRPMWPALPASPVTSPRTRSSLSSEVTLPSISSSRRSPNLVKAGGPFHGKAWGGNEAYNPSFYPLPLGKREFAPRSGPGR